MNVLYFSQAKIVERLLGFEIEVVSCGSAHVMAVTNDGEVFAWGRGDAGNHRIVTPHALDVEIWLNRI